jgi:hypothetical protein
VAQNRHMQSKQPTIVPSFSNRISVADQYSTRISYQHLLRIACSFDWENRSIQKLRISRLDLSYIQDTGSLHRLANIFTGLVECEVSIIGNYKTVDRSLSFLAQFFRGCADTICTIIISVQMRENARGRCGDGGSVVLENAAPFYLKRLTKGRLKALTPGWHLLLEGFAARFNGAPFRIERE